MKQTKYFWWIFDDQNRTIIRIQATGAVTMIGQSKQYKDMTEFDEDWAGKLGKEIKYD